MPLTQRCVGALVCVLLLGCRGERRDQSAAPPPFREAATESGLRFQHFNGAAGDYLMPEIVGSGVAVLDFDGDGKLDVFLVQGDFVQPGHAMKDARFPPPAGWEPGCKLFRNDTPPGGKLHFVDVTAQSGIRCPMPGMGVATGDYDNDGRPDLYVTGFGRAFLYHNNGDGTFRDATKEAGVADDAWSTSATFFDYDRDGRLDLFVTHYVHFVPRPKQCQSKTGEPDYCGPQVFQPSISKLYHNEGNGKFRDVTTASGIAAAAGPGLGVTAADVNGDGWPDLYVANDGAASYLWLNQGDGRFREAALEAGIALSMDGKTQAGMGIALGDFDNDGDEDIFKTNLTGEGANLYRNDGKGSFSEMGNLAKLTQATFRYTGFGTAWLDYDNDGWLDLAVVNGAVFMEESQRGQPFPYLQPNQLFHNESGRFFTDVSGSAGPGFADQAVGRGIAVGDLNNDGRLDFVVSSNNGPVRLFLNQTPPRHWLAVKLVGLRANADGIGARVGVFRNGLPTLWRRVHTDGSYLSAQDVRVNFGLGDSPRIDLVRVEWPDGSADDFRGVAADRSITLQQSAK